MNSKKEINPVVNKLKSFTMDRIENSILFKSYLKSKKFKVHYDQMLWGEGPCYIPDKDMLVWSDIPNNRMLKLKDKKVSEFRNPSNYVNGNTLDNQGNLISCSHGGRCLYKSVDYESSETLINSYKNFKLNSPNDVVVKSDDTIWFTDPPYGILSNYEGYIGKQEYGGCYVFRYNPHNQKLDVMVDDLNRPNGLAFSNDEKKIYIADTGEDINCLYLFDIDNDNNLSSKKLLYDFSPFFSDGFRSDQDGNIWTSAGFGIKCFNKKGEIIGQLLLPELVSNLEFGGREGNILYVTATKTLYSIELNQIGDKFK